MRFIDGFKAILFDMNGTFMFDEDRLDAGQDFYQSYSLLGGSTMTSAAAHKAVRSTCQALGRDYDDPESFEVFPSPADAVLRHGGVFDEEAWHIERVIAMHEVGHVPEWAAASLRALSTSHVLGVVSNVWADAHYWNAELRRARVAECCHCLVFSSELGSIKPSPRLFLAALNALALRPVEVLFVGDSLERDILPAKSLGMATAWVGGKTGRKEANVLIGSIAQLEHINA